LLKNDFESSMQFIYELPELLDYYFQG